MDLAGGALRAPWAALAEATLDAVRDSMSSAASVRGVAVGQSLTTKKSTPIYLAIRSTRITRYPRAWYEVQNHYLFKHTVAFLNMMTVLKKAEHVRGDRTAKHLLEEGAKLLEEAEDEVGRRRQASIRPPSDRQGDGSVAPSDGEATVTTAIDEKGRAERLGEIGFHKGLCVLLCQWVERRSFDACVESSVPAWKGAATIAVEPWKQSGFDRVAKNLYWLDLDLGLYFSQSSSTTDLGRQMSGTSVRQILGDRLPPELRVPAPHP